MNFTLKDIQKSVEILQKNACKPKKVKGWLQAVRMTLNDPAGHKWKKGEEYYVVLSKK